MHALDSLMQGLKGKPENYLCCSKLNSCSAICYVSTSLFLFLGAVFCIYSSLDYD